MTYREVLSQRVIAISTSESPDMPVLGLTDEHLRDAMAEIARHLLALGARLAYGGDLRAYGFTDLLFELVARHSRDAD
jgi:H+/gluconate symporter-like permease